MNALNLTPLERSRFVSTYGQGYSSRMGVLSDHLSAVTSIEGVEIRKGNLVTYVVDRAGRGVAYPVLCGELIWIHDEDGRHDGRCGATATDIEMGTCEGHGIERREWAATSEAEKLAWERQPERAW